MEDNGIDLPRPGRGPVRGERPLHAPGFPDADAMALHGLGLVPMDMSEDEASEGDDSDEDGLDADEVRPPMLPGLRFSQTMPALDSAEARARAQYAVSLVPMPKDVCVTRQMQRVPAVGMASVMGEVKLFHIIAWQ